MPLRKASGKRDIYVTRKARFASLKARVIGLLDKGPEPVVLHALGAAITRCCDLGLAIESLCAGGVLLAIETGTVVVYDDYESLVEVGRVLSVCAS